MLNYLNQPSAPIAEVLTQPVAEATRQQDVLARQRGFRSYEEMLAWSAQQQQARDAAAQGRGGAVPGGSGLPRTWDEAWSQLKSMHPKYALEYVTKAMGGGQ